MPTTSTNRVTDADIDRASAIHLADIAEGRGFVFNFVGRYVGPCPHCGGKDRFSIDTRKQAFRCRQCFPKGGGGAIRLVMFLDKVGFREAIERLIGRRNTPVKYVKLPDMVVRNSAGYERQQREKACWLWSQRRPITGTIAEKYLREVRGITCTLPPTLAFLPPSKPEHHPALISAFGLCDEIESGIIAAPREIISVHLTLLKPDGTGKIETKPNKIMIGSPTGRPIIVAPPNDLLGLAVCEGVEDALSAHQALGLGAWAAGTAGLMPKLADAVPDYIDCVTIYAHADRAGQDGANGLAAKFRERDIEVIIEGIDT